MGFCCMILLCALRSLIHSTATLKLQGASQSDSHTSNPQTNLGKTKEVSKYKYFVSKMPT